MTRQELFDWVQQYGTEPEYPWHDWNAVLRRKDNDKWYGVVLEVAGGKLGLTGEGIVDVLNVKSDPILIGSLRGQDGYFPAYHMNKEKWISVLLGKPELDDSIKDLLALSYELTGGISATDGDGRIYFRKSFRCSGIRRLYSALDMVLTFRRY